MATQPNLHQAARISVTGLAIAIACLFAAVRANAAIIDFETTPAGLTPVDDATLSFLSPYTFPGLQVSFGIDSDLDSIVDSSPRFEQAGLGIGEPPNGGFQGSSGPDTADPGFTAQLGNWFLRGPSGPFDFGLLVISYSGSTVVTAASGEIWDIDGTAQAGGPPGFTEEYTVRAYDSLNNLLATQVSPLGVLETFSAPLDGRPWVFSFSGLTAGISKITVDFTGSKVMGIGLAFNNFNPTSVVPEPAAWLLATLGVVFIFISSVGRRRTQF